MDKRLIAAHLAILLAVGCGQRGTSAPDTGSACDEMPCNELAYPVCEVTEFYWKGRCVCRAAPDSCPMGMHCVDGGCIAVTRFDGGVPCQASETECGAFCCRNDVEWCDTSGTAALCRGGGRNGEPPVVVFGASRLIDGWHVEYEAGWRASWNASSVLLSASSATLSFEASVNYQAGTLPDASLVYEGAALLAQVVAACYWPSNDSQSVPATAITAMPATCTDADACTAAFSMPLEAITCPGSSTLGAYEVAFSWLRVFSGPSGRSFQWMQSGVARTCPVDQSCDPRGTFLVYRPIAESLAAPLDDWKGQKFDYVAWTEQHLTASGGPDAGR